MIDINTMWEKRFLSRINSYMKYLRYIFSDHLIIVLLILIGGGGYYYQEWLKNSSENFPWIIVTSIIWMLVIIPSPIMTFLNKADIIYLTPSEYRLSNYFRKCLLVSFGIQMFTTVLFILPTLPLLNKYDSNIKDNLFIYIFIIILMKVWNLYISWVRPYLLHKLSNIALTFTQMVVTFIIFYLLLTNNNLFAFSIALMLSISIFILNKYVSNKTFSWLYWIDKDEVYSYRIYKIANLVTDVPIIGGQLNRRKYLDVVLPKINFNTNNRIYFILWRTWARSGDYFGLFFRLQIVLLITFYMMELNMFVIVFFIAFLYAYGIQLLPILGSLSNNVWWTILPGKDAEKTKSIGNFFTMQLFVFGTLSSLMILLVHANILYFLTCFISAIIFSIIFTKLVITRKAIT
ncbi:MAG: transporter permease [Bacillales bacterium]|jgi:ABC-2 type transport system permease protein|nr:transporter permease [Bacillales bacterium]